MSTTSTVARVLTVVLFDKVSVTVMARVTGYLGTPVKQADVASVSCAVYDLENANAVTGIPAVVVSSSVFDTLQGTAAVPDPRWTADATGYNFLYRLPASCFPAPHTFQAEFKFTPTAPGYDPYPLVVRVAAQALLSF